MNDPKPGILLLALGNDILGDDAVGLIAGRMIDADEGSFGAVRVMVNCNQMGEAAGVAAALSIRHRQTVSDVDISKLQAALVAGGSARI